MISINPPFQVLVTAGNQAIAPAGKKIWELLAGQLGVFDYDTGLAIDGTKTAQNSNVFLAVGINRGGAAASPATDIRHSAGESIKKHGVRAFTMKPYEAPVNQIERINFGQIIPGKDYLVKFEINNQEAFANYGYNTPSKVFPMIGGPEVDPATGLASTLAFATQLVNYINADEEKFMTATLVAGGSATAASITVEFLPLTAKTSLTGVNLLYLKPLGTSAFTSLVDFDGSATSATTQALVFSDTTGYDLAQLEYEAGGWNGNPGIYRNSDITGFTGAETFAVPATGYDTYSITYDNMGIGAGEKYGSSLLSIVAVPQADNTTALAVKTLFERLFNGGEALDAAAIAALPDEDIQTGA